MDGAIVFTAYNRPNYFAPVMHAWAAVRGVATWAPHVYCEPSPVSAEITDIARCHGIATTVNRTRLGVLRNPWHALDTAFGAGYRFVVLAEDDVLVSDDICEYFTWAATTFVDDHVLAVCAATFAPTCAPEDTANTHLTRRFCPLVWGTWADRWAGVLRDTWDKDYSSGTRLAPQSGWDWNINLRVMADWRIVTPAASRSTHIGEHGGIHTTAQTYPTSIAATFTPHRPPADYRSPS